MLTGGICMTYGRAAACSDRLRQVAGTHQGPAQVHLTASNLRQDTQRRGSASLADNWRSEQRGSRAKATAKRVMLAVLIRQLLATLGARVSS